MPSLQALREFKASLSTIGDEISARAESHVPYEDLELPDQEPLVADEPPKAPQKPDLSGDVTPDFSFAGLDDPTMTLGEIPAGDIIPPRGVSGGDDTDLLALLDTIPDDLGQPAEEPVEDFADGDADADALVEDFADGEEAPAGDFADGGDFPDGGDLLDGLDGGDLPAGLGEDAAGEAPADDFANAADAATAEDFQIPDDLLGGLEGDLAGAPAGDFDDGGDFPGGLGDDVASGAADDFADGGDLSDAGMDFGGETPSGDFDDGGDFPGGLADDFAAADTDFGGETPAGDFDDGGDLLDSLDSGDLLDGLGEDAAGDLPVADDFSIPGMDLGGEAPAGGFGDAGDLDGEAPPELPAADDFSIPGMDLGGELGDESPADSFDSFDLGGDAFDTDFGETEEEAAEPAGMDEFALPGIDDMFGGGVPGTGGTGGTASSRGAPEDIEEIQLSDEDLEQLQKTLAGYPLNLRIACEELIAEQAVAPDMMSKLIKLLVQGAAARETASLAGKILGRTINIPRGFEKSTGAALEAEQGSFAYIFVHNFLPVLRLFLIIAAVTASLFYLTYEFVYTPLRAESIYKLGYERLFAGEYQRANDRFSQAFNIHRDKKWFYRYAEGFRDERQYLYAEEKYDDLLRYYPRDKKGVLDYAAMETSYIRNYAKAEELLRRNLLDYAPNDREGLLALGDNSLAWGEIDASKYEDARFSYARLLDLYGWTDPVVERMLLYFIRTDNLKEVLPLQAYFTDNKRRKISAATLAELGGYLLDKRLEEVRGVPNEYVEQIEGIRDLLLRAVKTDPALPESHYHLARYYRSLNNAADEQVTLETAIRAFDSSPEGSIRRIMYRIDTQKRYADVLINNREFFPAREQLVKGAGIYEDAFSRRLLARSPEFGKLYAGLGDLEYFTREGDMDLALQYYRRSEQHGWAPPEMLYRMGSAHYYLEEWRDALERFFTASAELPLNRRLLYALGNASYQRGDYFAAQGYYNRLLDILETDRSRLPLLLPNDQPEFIELAERLMIARNNMGAACEALAGQTGDNRYRNRALALYSESARAWDSLTRNPQSMTRALPAPGIYGGSGSSLPQLNTRYMLYPEPGYEPKIFLQIDKDVLEPSSWERLAPSGSRLSGMGAEPLPLP
jgi:hypothetical protein